jgi:hypothetical protein
MKKQGLQDVVWSTYVLGDGGKIFKGWGGGGYSKRGAHYVRWLEASGRGKKRGT